MIRGIGIDSVSISEFRQIAGRMSKGALQRLFTVQEITEAKKLKKPEEYLAARFAVKEAVFKAIAHLTNEKAFDLRIVETLNMADGYPYINRTSELERIIKQTDVAVLHVSITTEKNIATAFVIAESFESHS